jgi:hypothetical protein
VNEVDVALAALGAVVTVVLAEHLAIWSLFYRCGWRVMCPTAKPGATTTNSVAPAAGNDTPAGATVQNIPRAS